MSELKPCPYCGGKVQSISNHLSYPQAHCTNELCVGRWSVVDAGGWVFNWNTRPIEDALQARIDEQAKRTAALESENARLKEIMGRLVEYVGEHHIHPCIMKSVKELLEAK
jgi:endogenous inhibitor of DNA gyrase (YacG/DUF329 family)